MSVTEAKTPAQPSRGVGVVETSVLWAAKDFMASGGGSKEVPDEFAQSHELFVNLLHNLLLFEELRTGLSIDDEEDWYTRPVMDMVAQLQGVVSVKGMPQQDREDQDAFLDNFAIGYARWLNEMPENLADGPRFSMPSFYEKRVIRPRSSDERIFHRLRQIVAGTAIARGRDEHERILLAANGAFLFRGLRYAGHAHYLARREGRAAVYSASPGRITTMARFLDGPELTNIPLLQSDYLPLIEYLDLPRSGYDFSYLTTTLRPVRQRGLTERLLEMPPQQALERVLEIRQTPEGERVRQIWAERLLRPGRSSIEGPANLTVSHTTAGTIVQILAVAREDALQGEPRQEVRNSTVAGRIQQQDASGRAWQRVEKSEAKELWQQIEGRLAEPRDSPAGRSRALPDRLGSLFRKRSRRS
jgi:hypothetical protein